MTRQIAARSLVALIIASLIGVAGKASAQSGSCPRATPITGRVAMKPLQQKRLTWFRRQYHLGDITHHELRVLRDPNDKSLCEALDKIFAAGPFASKTRTYYRARAYFFASFGDSLSLADHNAPPRLFVLDPKLRVFATIAPRLDR